MKRPVGRPCMQLQGQASSSHSPFRPFLWGINADLVKIAIGKDRVASLIEEAHVQALAAVVHPMRPMGSLPISLHSSSSSGSSQQWGALEFTKKIPDRTLTKSLRTKKRNPRHSYKLKRQSKRFLIMVSQSDRE